LQKTVISTTCGEIVFHLKTFVGTVGYLYREQLNFAWQYSRLEEAKDPEKLRAAAQKTASASADVVDVLILDENNRVTFPQKTPSLPAERWSLQR